MTRLRFTTLAIIVGAITASPGLLISIEIHPTAIAMFTPITIAACCLSAEPFYAGAIARSARGLVPWPQCLAFGATTYIVFGLLVGGVAVKVPELTFGWPALAAFLMSSAFFTTAAAAFTGWLAVPLCLYMARRVRRSNNALQATCEDARA